MSVATEVAELVAKKNKAYGDSFNKCADFIKLLYPNGISPEQYKDMLTIVRVFDKLMRIANEKNAFDESPWRDINGYSLLACTDQAEENDNVIEHTETPKDIRSWTQDPTEFVDESSGVDRESGWKSVRIRADGRPVACEKQEQIDGPKRSGSDVFKRCFYSEGTKPSE